MRDRDDATAAFFREHGWAIIREVVEPSLVPRLIDAFDAVLPPDSAEAGIEGLVLQRPGGGAARPELLGHLTRGGLAARVADFLGCDGLQLLQDSLVLKPARTGGRVDWHRDFTYTGFIDRPSAVSIRLSLVRSTVSTGCLQVLDGSHRWEFDGRHAIFSDRLESELDALPPHLRERVDQCMVPLELEPGDATVHHCLTFHSSKENRSARHRRTVIAHVFDAACKLRPDRLPGPEARERFGVDDRGHLNQETFPVLFRRSARAAPNPGARRQPM